MSDILSKPNISIDPEVLNELKTKYDLEQQVIVHCAFKNNYPDLCLIRIWSSTFLFDQGSSHSSKLLHVENIPLAPMWLPVYKGHTAKFTLIFGKLPKDCSKFDLKEIIPESGGYEVLNITRNQTDVYHITL